MTFGIKVTLVTDLQSQSLSAATNCIQWIVSFYIYSYTILLVNVPFKYTTTKVLTLPLCEDGNSLPMLF